MELNLPGGWKLKLSRISWNSIHKNSYDINSTKVKYIYMICDKPGDKTTKTHHNVQKTFHVQG